MRRTQARTRTPSADVTDSLVEAALDLLEADGQDAITVRAVATRAGVAPMGVYSRFGSKDGLLEALFVQGFTWLQETITGASGRDALARLRSGCLAYREFAVAHPHLYGLMFREMLELELSAESLECAERSFAQLVGRVADAMSAGQVAAGDEVDVAQLTWNALHGGVSLELAGVTFSSDPEATFGRMVDALLVGIASRPTG
jgi:AcrR family transcriptional regulator